MVKVNFRLEGLSMSKTRSDKHPLIVMGLLVVSSLWLVVVLAWCANIAFSLTKQTALEPISSNVQQQDIQNAIELFSSLSLEE